MVGESIDEQHVAVSLPSDLKEWLDRHTATLDVDRETLLLNLLSAYRTTVDLDENGDGSDVAIDIVEGNALEGNVNDRLDAALDDHLDSTLQARLDAALDERIEELVDRRVDDAVETALEESSGDLFDEQVNEATSSVQRQLEERIERVESDFGDKIQDVRERVIQVKKETDTKAPKDHTHEELETVDALSEQVASLESTLETLRGEYDETVPDHESTLETLDERLDEVENRLQTVAWVVSDLRKAQESDSGLEAVERIKRAAAKADVERATCENCGNGVSIPLLTDPECPHCEATVTNVEPAGGWFSKPKLLVASQLESGDQQ